MRRHRIVFDVLTEEASSEKVEEFAAEVRAHLTPHARYKLGGSVELRGVRLIETVGQGQNGSKPG